MNNQSMAAQAASIASEAKAVSTHAGGYAMMNDGSRRDMPPGRCAAQSVVTAFAAGIGQPPHFNPHALRERKAAKMDYMMRNAKWFAEIIG